MGKAISELWKVFLESIRQIQEPGVRFLAGMSILVITWLVIYSLSALVVHGIVDIVEIVANAINGIEPPKT